MGKAIEPEKMIKALKDHPERRSAPSSTPRHRQASGSPWRRSERIAKKTDTLFLVDAVTSLGGLRG